MGTSASDPKCGSLRTQARKKSSIAWSHLSVGGCTRRSTPGFLFCGSDLVASGGREEVPQGISEASRKATKTRGKIPAQAGETELEGEIAQRDRIRPTRQVPSQLIWRDREAVKSERAILIRIDRDIPMDSEEHVL